MTVLTLGIGIGVNAAMVATIDGLLLRPPPGVATADRLARLLVVTDAPGGRTVGHLSSYPMATDLARQVPAFEDVAAYTSATLSLGLGPEAISVGASLVSANYFTLLGARTAVGRWFTRADDQPSVVLGNSLWRSRFGGRTDVVGRRLRIGNAIYTVVGVAEPGFRGIEDAPPDLWLPLAAAVPTLGLPLDLSNRGAAWLSLVARLASGVSRGLAEDEATTVWRRSEPRGGAQWTGRVVAASVIPGRSPDAPRAVRVAMWLSGVSLLVLLLVCANVSSILLGRGIARREEFAIRTAIGASRGRLGRQVMTETVLLVSIGALAATAFAMATSALQGQVGMPAAQNASVSTPLLAAIGFAALTAIALVGLGPMLQTTAIDPARALAGGRGAGGARTAGVRTALLVVQATLCMTMLIGAGMFVVSLRRVEGLDLGIDVDHTLVARFDLSPLALPKEELDAAFAEMLRRVRAVPGVSGAAVAQGDPNRGGRAVAIHTETHDQDFYWHEGVTEIPMEVAVGRGYFTTVGARSLRGRDFGGSDRRDAPRVAIINEPLAHRLWPDQDALGRCVFLPIRANDRGGECVTIVGVLRGYWKYDILNRDVLAVYVPFEQQPAVLTGTRRPDALYVHVRGDARSAVAAVRAALQGVRADLPAVSIKAMGDVVAPQVRPWRLAAAVFALFGAIALAVAGIGLYATVSFIAAQRSREVAIRVALGARAGHIAGAVAGRSLAAIAGGLVLGVIFGLIGARWAGPLLFETSPTDPLIIGGASVALFLTAAVALVFPLRSALSGNFGAALRT